MIWPFNRGRDTNPSDTRDAAVSWKDLLGPAKTPSEERIAHSGLAAAYEDIKTIVRASAEAQLSFSSNLDPPSLIAVNREIRGLFDDGKRAFHLLSQLASSVSSADVPSMSGGRGTAKQAFRSLTTFAQSLGSADDTRVELLAEKLGESLAKIELRSKALLGAAPATELAARLAAEYRPISPAEAHAFAPGLVREAAHYGRVAIIGKPPSDDDAAALSLLLADADVAVTADGSTVVPLRPRWQEAFGASAARREPDESLDPPRRELKAREESAVRDLVEAFGAASESSSRSERRALTDELIALRRELREHVTIARHWLDCGSNDRFRTAIGDLDVIETKVAERIGEVRASLGSASSTAKMRLRVESVADLDSSLLSAELSELTERHLYKPGDPRIWEYGGTVTAQSAETFESLLREGAHLTTIRGEGGALAGYVLHLDPEHAAEKWPRLAIRYDPYGKAAFVYFIVVDGRAAAGAPIYETLLDSVTIQLGDADVTAGLVVEDNLRGMIVHTAAGGGQIYPGDWKNFVSDFDSPAGGGRSTSVALGIAFGSSPQWRSTFGEVQPSRRDCIELANEILMRRYRGVFTDDFRNILNAVRKTQMRDLYLTALTFRRQLLEDVRARVGGEALETSRPIEFSNGTYNEDLLQVIHPDTPPLQRLRAAVEMTLPGPDLRAIEDARVWDRVAAGRDAAGAIELLVRILEADSEKHGFFKAQEELIFDVWKTQDDLIRELNLRFPRQDGDWCADVYYLGVDEWPRLLKKIALAAGSAPGHSSP